MVGGIRGYAWVSHPGYPQAANSGNPVGDTLGYTPGILLEIPRGILWGTPPPDTPRGTSRVSPGGTPGVPSGDRFWNEYKGRKDYKDLE